MTYLSRQKPAKDRYAISIHISFFAIYFTSQLHQLIN